MFWFQVLCDLVATLEPILGLFTAVGLAAVARAALLAATGGLNPEGFLAPTWSGSLVDYVFSLEFGCHLIFPSTFS